jgi:hypothetical protein
MSIKPHKRQLPQRIIILPIFTMILVFILPSVMSFAKADTINPGVYSINDKPYGLPYGNWTAKFWQWVLPIPKDLNPAIDNTGQKCAQSQSGPVWLLLGAIAGSAERTCTIPAGKAILFPLLNSECSYTETPTARSESDLRTCALAGDASATNLQATVDGRNLQQVDKYRVQSGLFNVTLAENNILGVHGGPTKSVSDGWWVFLQPLSVGRHEIHFGGVLGNPTVTSTQPRYVVDVTYHLTVQ